MNLVFKKILTAALFFLFMNNAFGVPKLSSYPAAQSTIYLDFDGHFVNSAMWNSNVPFVCTGSGMSDNAIIESFNRTAEDFRPFNVNITTDSSMFLAASIDKRIRIIVTSTNWYPGVGGVSWLGSFVWGDDTPGFVFSAALGLGPKLVGECCSHEIGHTLGLSHQSKYAAGDCDTPLEEYNSGTGSGETGWAPIMGNSYYKNLSSWNKGTTPYGCTSIQDNLAVITTQNGFTYRADDYSEVMNASTAILSGTDITKSGVISTNTDKDAFKISFTRSSNLHLSAIPFNVAGNYSGANLDIRLSLYNSAGTLIKTYDPVDHMSLIVDTVLNAGSYYILIGGGGSITNYGSMGAYTLMVVTGVLPIQEVALNGVANKNNHDLSWNIVASEKIKEIMIEASADGRDFKTIVLLSGEVKKYQYQHVDGNALYYRLKVVSILNQVMYSNIIMLRSKDDIDGGFKVSTFIHSSITVAGPRIFQYQVSNMSGAVVAKGNGIAGINDINMAKQPAGMYIVSIFSSEKITAVRIIKQ